MTVYFRDCKEAFDFNQTAPLKVIRCALGWKANVMNNCEIITSSKCDLNVISGQFREIFSDRRHIVVVTELITAGKRNC